MVFGLILLIVVFAVVMIIHLLPWLLALLGISHIAKKSDSEEPFFLDS
ncbi:MAG: hypothetical protein J6Y16_07385 [Treponema sp.]|jgi:hypothetical protein|nr:hypothetical protein [Treponema sp.]